jgi:hypothetical protein
MALLFMDSFDHYATADILEKWTTSPNASLLAIGAYGRNSTSGLRMPVGALNSVQMTCLGGVSEVILGVAIKPNVHTGAQATTPIVFGSAGAWECGICLNADLTLQPFTVNSGSYVPGASTNYTLIGTATTAALQAGVYAYLEVQMKCDGSVGTCVIRLNGTEVKNLTDLDTLYTSATLTRFALGCRASTEVQLDFDDLVVMDLTGSFNKAFIGDGTVTAYFPDADGNTHAWICSAGTPDTGVDYDCVNEASPNDDTDYLSTSTLNAKSTFSMQDCAAGSDIRAVQILASVRKGADGPGQVKLVTRSASTDYDGAAQGIGGTTYAYVREVREVDPATSAAWTEGGWNAVELGLKKTA